jgi:hypothetical protein
MKKYRARWNSEKYVEGERCVGSDCWLTDDSHIHTLPKKAAVGSLGETVNRIAQMSLNEPRTVSHGRWTLEHKHKGWIAVE